MKTVLLVMCFLCAPLALGQSTAGTGALSAEPVVTQFYSHDKHATQTPMASQQSLLPYSEYAFGRGQRPLWEVMPEPRTVSLGELARELRKQHALAKKSEIVWVN